VSNDTLMVLKIKSCPACNSTMLEDFVNGQVVCRDCGLVINSEIKRNDHVRSTDISHQAAGKRSTAIAHQYENDFLEWQKLLRVSDSTERNAALTLYYITKIVRKLQLPFSVLEESINIYRTLICKRSFKGMRLKAASAAIVYASCKILGVPCSLREVAKVSDEDQSKVFHCYSFIVENLEIPQTQNCTEESLNRLCKTMKIDALTWDTARKLIKIIKQKMVTDGRNPYGYLAAVIYIASIITGKKRTQRELAEITRTTEATIRTRYKELIERIQLVMGV